MAAQAQTHLTFLKCRGFDRQPRVTHRHRDALGIAGGWQFLARAQVMRNLSEYPGIADGRAANHHAVNTRLDEHPFGVLGRLDVAIAQHGDADGFLHAPDNRPVGLALETLFRKAAMHRDHLDAHILSGAREVDGGDAPHLEARPHLDCHRNFDGLHDRIHDGGGGGDILEQGRACALPGYFGNPAAHIDVHDFRAHVFDEARALGHCFGIVAEELHRDRTFALAPVQHAEGAFIAVLNGLAADQFRADQSTAARFLAQDAVGVRRHLRHRREGDGRMDHHVADGKGRQIFADGCFNKGHRRGILRG